VAFLFYQSAVHHFCSQSHELLAAFLQRFSFINDGSLLGLGSFLVFGTSLGGGGIGQQIVKSSVACQETFSSVASLFALRFLGFTLL